MALLFGLLLVYLFVLPAPVMWLWNATLPDIASNVTEITYWQSFRLLLLVGFMVGGAHFTFSTPL